MRIMYKGLRKGAEEKTIYPQKWIVENIKFAAHCHKDDVIKMYFVDGVKEIL